MTAYIIRRILFMIPTLFGIMLVSFVVVQFAPGGPVERVIAQLSGSDTGATSRISGSPGGDFGARGQPGGASGVDAVNSQISRRPGPRSRVHQEPGEAVRLRQAGLRALLPDAVELSAVRFRQELFPRHHRAAAHQGEAAGLDLARHLADAADLSDLDPARHPQGDPGRLAVRRLDVGRHHRRLCDPGLPVRDPAHHPVRRRLVLQHFPAARADLRLLGAVVAGGRRSSTISGIWCCRSSRWGLPPSPP